MKTGDNVLISPEVTHKNDWIWGTVIDVEDNSFVGTVISAETPSGEIFFDKDIRRSFYSLTVYITVKIIYYRKVTTDNSSYSR